MIPASSASGVAAPDASSGRATRAIIDLDALAGNVRAMGRLLSPGTELLAVVKANAYGHGARMVARTALAAGATRLGVATVGEGAALRGFGITAPILLLGPIDPGEARVALSQDLEPTVGTDALLEAVEDAARSLPLGGPAQVHVKVDTGMRRYGATPDGAVALAGRIAANPMLTLAGLSTHFAAADDPDERFTLEQAARFDRCLERLAELGIPPASVHAANSAATIRSRRYDYDVVRVGIALYGLRPSPSIVLPEGMEPVLSLRSRVTRIIDLLAGETVGYGRAHRVTSTSQGALVPIGYADGYRRALSERGWMGIGGKRGAVMGRVSMDQTVIEIPDGVSSRVGDKVIVLGTLEDGAPTVEAMAETIGTIAYEVVTGLTTRVERVYRRGGALLDGEEVIETPG